MRHTKAPEARHRPAADAVDSFADVPAPRRPHPFTVVYDPGAAIELAKVKSKEERKAIFNAVDKLRQLAHRLAPPHLKPLQGAGGPVRATAAAGAQRLATDLRPPG